MMKHDVKVTFESPETEAKVTINLECLEQTMNYNVDVPQVSEDDEAGKLILILAKFFLDSFGESNDNTENSEDVPVIVS